MDGGIDSRRKRVLDELYRGFRTVAHGGYLYLCDMKYDYSRWSVEAVQDFGLPGNYMVRAGEIWEQCIHPDDREGYHQSIEDIFAGRDRGHDMQYRVKNTAGRYVVCTCRGTVLWDEQGQPDYFVGSIHNHGQENNVDPLTGFQNQYGLFETLKMLYAKKQPANIMMLGVGHFSTINEMWGYDFGNTVIHKLVQLLKKTFRNEGMLYRVDGVRFVLLTRTLSLDELSRRYEALYQDISLRLEVDGYHPNLEICGSALEIEDFDIDPQAMFSCLTYAYVSSREKGNGSFRIFHRELDADRNNLLVLVNAVRKSIENNCAGFVLYYQPIVEAATGRLCGSEALLRWENPEFGLVPPNRFIPIIENDPAFVHLGEWILRKAMEDTKPFLAVFPDFELNVNISYDQIKQDNFVQLVRRNLDAAGFPAHNLCLEITERCRLLDMERLAAIVSELQSIGVRFAIDDFGTGYSSMSILNSMKFDVVKIDKSFVDGVAAGGRELRLVKVMHDMAGLYGARVCAEGVETKEQCDILRECGIDCIQGYYFSRPVEVETFRERFVEQA